MFILDGIRKKVANILYLSSGRKIRDSAEVVLDVVCERSEFAEDLSPKLLKSWK